MKHYISCILIVMVTITLVKINIACTSFVIYSGNDTLYGMNFDYPDREIHFLIEYVNDTSRILKAFFSENGILKTYNGFSSAGIFSTIQMLYPQADSPPPQTNQISLFDAWYYSLHAFSSIDAFQEYLVSTGTTVYQETGSFHSLMADRYGNAIVLETGEDQNHITTSENGFLVNTNFPLHQFAGLPYTAVSGVGAGRYIDTYEYLTENYANFNYTNGWEALEISLQHTGTYKTQCSMLFNPKTREIFLALNRDLSHIWRILLDEAIIETYSGFGEYTSLAFNGGFISEYDLLTMVGNQESISEKSHESYNIPNPFSHQQSGTWIYSEIPDLYMNRSGFYIDIYDISGTLINSYPIQKNQSDETNQIKFYWEGTDAHNNIVRAGAYIYTIRNGDKIITRRKMLICS